MHNKKIQAGQKGFLESVMLLLLVTATVFIILIVLPDMLWIWTRFTEAPCKVDISKRVFNSCPEAPVTMESVIKPEYIPLTSDHALFTLLATKDNQTGLEIQELLALAAHNHSQTISVGGNTYDVLAITQAKLAFIISGYDYSFLEESDPAIQIGKKDIVPQFTSYSSITLPDLSQVRVILKMG